jgi:N6-L-threonylcarbamoyladenine synthase
MTERPGLDFSFSGLKTAVVVALSAAVPATAPGVALPPASMPSPDAALPPSSLKSKDRRLDEQMIADVALAFEEAAIETLVIKCRRALEATNHARLVVAGGVSANTKLRARLQQLVEKKDVKVYFPRPEFATDNGAMIAYAGFLRLRAGSRDGLAFGAQPRWDIEELPALER